MIFHHIAGVMVNMLVSSAEDNGFDFRLGHTNN